MKFLIIFALVLLGSSPAFASDGDWGRLGDEVRASVLATGNCLEAKDCADHMTGTGHSYTYKIPAFNAAIEKCYSELRLPKDEQDEVIRRFYRECNEDPEGLLGWMGIAMMRSCEMNLVAEAWKRHH